MGDRPEKLWLGAPCSDQEQDVWFDPDEGGTEYVRADLYATLTAERDALRARVDELTVLLKRGAECPQSGWTIWQGVARAALTQNPTISVT